MCIAELHKGTCSHDYLIAATHWCCCDCEISCLYILWSDRQRAVVAHCCWLFAFSLTSSLWVSCKCTTCCLCHPWELWASETVHLQLAVAVLKHTLTTAAGPGTVFHQYDCPLAALCAVLQPMRPCCGIAEMRYMVFCAMHCTG